MADLDDQERAIARALIRNPRASDNRIGEQTGVPVRTVSRKRHRMEQRGVLSYHAAVGASTPPGATPPVRHLALIKFQTGVTQRQILEEIRSEPNVSTVFTQLIYESHIADMDGHIGLVMIVEGRDDAEVIESLHSKIIPSLRKNHGKNSILELHTIRLLAPIRLLRNYLPDLNMKDGVLKPDWPDNAIHA